MDGGQKIKAKDTGFGDLLFLFLFETGSLCSSSCPVVCYVDKAGLNLPLPHECWI